MKEIHKKELAGLKAKFEENAEQYHSLQYNEMNTRNDFIDELFVFWTGMDDISEIQCLHNLKKLYLDNGDKTKIDFSNFPFLEVLLSWDRKNIETAWNIPSLKELKLYGLKKKQYKEGESLKSLIIIRLKKYSSRRPFLSCSM